MGDHGIIWSHKRTKARRHFVTFLIYFGLGQIKCNGVKSKSSEFVIRVVCWEGRTGYYIFTV